MKYLRITSRPDPEAAPAVFRIVADSTAVDEARLLEWNRAGPGGVTVLFAVDGDREALEPALADAPGVTGLDASSVGADRHYVLASVRPGQIPVASDVLAAVVRDGLVVRTPVVYRDGAAHIRLVGRTDAVQDAVEGLPDAVDVTVEAIGHRGFDPGSVGAALSDRQREALLAAVDMGYYDASRTATHEDLADRLDCAPSTASEHLKKAESKLLTSLADYLDPSGASESG